MISKLCFIVVDDNDDFRIECQKSIESVSRGLMKPSTATSHELLDAIKSLERSLASMRKDKSAQPPSTLFDAIDIVFVDYDLLDLGNSGTISGEDVAYLLRVLSGCGIIVLINPSNLGSNGFDLRLQGTMDSWADFFIGATQIRQKWLWEDKIDGLSPWAWPNLIAETRKRSLQITAARQAMDESILEAIGVPSQSLTGVDMALIEAIMANKTTPHTLRQMVKSPITGVHPRDLKVVDSLSDMALARVAASRVAAWVDRVALPSQAFLVDGPHLATRAPGMLAKGVNRASLEATVSRDWKIGKKAFAPRAATCMPTAPEWFTRPVWIWPEVRSHEDFGKWVSRKQRQEAPVFLEDMSKFAPPDRAFRFGADTPGHYSLRHAGKVTDVDYRPSFRFSL